MNLVIMSKITPYRADPRLVVEALAHLSDAGYRPLITEAKRRFVEVFDNSQQVGTTHASPRIEDLFEYRRMVSRYSENLRTPIAGDLFYGNEEKSILYLALTVLDPFSILRGRVKEAEVDKLLEIGFIGDEDHKDVLKNMEVVVSDFLKGRGLEVAWTPSETECPSFIKLRQSQENKFVLASSLTEHEIQHAQQLEDMATRSLAIVVKRSGGILVSDLIKKSAMKAEQIQSIASNLNKHSLLQQEYVVICKKTSNQINRLPSIEKFEIMKEIGVLCSCGNPIGEERIEELFSPTQALQKMLNGSYWMTARLVRLLRQLNIPDERILLNLQEGAEEIDAFVDLEGTLLMFELKDSEFSMGHAYPFGGRIGLYKPDTAIIVSTKGIAPEVQEYFKRVKPSAEIVYVTSLDEFDTILQTVVTKVRARRAQELISQFEPIAQMNMPVFDMIAKKIGIGNSRRRRRMEDEPPL